MKSTSSDLEIVPGNGKHTILDQGEFEFWTMGEHGVQFKPNTPRDVWLNFMHSATEMHESSGRLHFRAMCIVADGLNFGEDKFSQEFSQVIDATREWMRVKAKTLANAMWVMSKIPATRRRELLTLSHHEAVASLDDPKEQDELLALAEEQNMTVAELRKAIAERHPKTKRGKERKSTKAAAHTITTLAEAKDALTQASNILTANEEKITDAWRPLLEHFYKLYRRKWMSGHKR